MWDLLTLYWTGNENLQEKAGKTYAERLYAKNQPPKIARESTEA
jgi:hypothetical protein